MNENFYWYIVVMAGVTYLIRVIPLVLLQKSFSNVYLKTFLHYVPFVTLAVMTFPAILESTATIWSAGIGFVVAVTLAYQQSSLIKVAATACAAVFLSELILVTANH